MRKITTKMILLMLVIPMLLVFSLVTTIDMTTIMIDNIPVTSVNIEGEKVLFVDVSENNNTVKLSAVVSPKEATNKSVTYTSQAVNDERVALIDISSDGVVSPKSVGSVRVIATADGGRQDSVQINFYSSLVSEVEQINQNINIDVGEKKSITLGTDFNIYPSSANGSSITYSVNNNKVKIDKYTGEMTGLFIGKSIVTANIEGIKYDETDNKFVETVYSLDFTVTVASQSQQEIFSFAGGVTETEEVLALDSKVVPFAYLGYSTLGELSYSVSSEDEQYIKSVTFSYLSDDEGKIKVTLDDEAPEKDYVITIKAKDTELGKVTIKKQLPTIRISANKTTHGISNANITFGSVVEGLDDGYTVIYTSSNNEVFFVRAKGNDCVAQARKEGTASVTATLYIDDEEVAVSEPIQFTVINPYRSVAISEKTKTYGLENRFVLGKYEYSNGSNNTTNYQLNVKASNSDGVVTSIDNNKLKWSSSDNNIATVSSSGVVNVVNDGTVIITVESAYNSVLGTDIKSSFEITCRKQGLNVYDYEDLVWANENNYETVLMNNVMLADGITDNNYESYLKNVATKEMATTADNAYYRDNGKTSEAKIRYCLEFTQNVYGNGYAINADNITRAIDKYNYSLFNGPLDLVALKYGNISSGNAKVKAQDNIIFLVRKHNISLNNVELKGCSDSSLIESGQTNLGKLNNVGTVLEVVGDNMSLLYSRVNNGRTVVRIYGSQHEDDNTKIASNPDNYRIETLISNCILSYGREFILKVGSNQILRNEPVYNEELVLPSEDPSKYDHAAPYLKKTDGSNYSLNEAKDEYFINNYLMTDITLKDSVFFAAGLFCVGFESQFAGLALHGYDYGSYNFSELGWQRVGGTSYPARVKMQGDVRFYDWKEVNSIDSSTIVEGDTSLLETIGLDLNVSNLLNKFNEQNLNNKIIYKYEGNDYINGAVVFYGGGKNYSWIDTSGVNSSFNSLDSFEVPLSYFGKRVNLIYYAAGKENFHFMTYNSESNLNYEKQKSELADNSAYLWLIRK